MGTLYDTQYTLANSEIKIIRGFPFEICFAHYCIYFIHIRFLICINTENAGGCSYHIHTELILKLSSVYAYISQAVSFLQVFFFN
jgi:hypothetical protein